MRSICAALVLAIFSINSTPCRADEQSIISILAAMCTAPLSVPQDSTTEADTQQSIIDKSNAMCKQNFST
jgi:hypothetical protein